MVTESVMSQSPVAEVSSLRSGISSSNTPGRTWIVSAPASAFVSWIAARSVHVPEYVLHSPSPTPASVRSWLSLTMNGSRGGVAAWAGVGRRSVARTSGASMTASNTRASGRTPLLVSSPAKRRSFFFEATGCCLGFPRKMRRSLVSPDKGSSRSQMKTSLSAVGRTAVGVRPNGSKHKPEPQGEIECRRWIRPSTKNPSDPGADTPRHGRSR
jgi:hypothetical protein